MLAALACDNLTLKRFHTLSPGILRTVFPSAFGGLSGSRLLTLFFIVLQVLLLFWLWHVLCWRQAREYNFFIFRG